MPQVSQILLATDATSLDLVYFIFFGNFAKAGSADRISSMEDLNAISYWVWEHLLSCKALPWLESLNFLWLTPINIENFKQVEEHIFRRTFHDGYGPVRLDPKHIFKCSDGSPTASLLKSFLSTSSILLALGGGTQMSVPALLNLEPSITL